MLIKTIHGWHIPENRATPEHVFWNRRKFIAAAGFAGIGLAAGIRPSWAAEDPSAGLYPVPLNEMYKDAGRPITPEEIRLPTGSFVEPSDWEFYLLGRYHGEGEDKGEEDEVSQAQNPSPNAAVDPLFNTRDGGTEGRFGHDL